MKRSTQLIAIIGVILVAVVTRIIPHYPNVTALGAAALFGAAYFRKSLAVAVPLIALFISNLFLDNVIYAREFPEMYEGFVWFHAPSLWVYGAFIAVVLVGFVLLKKQSLVRIASSSVLGSLVFFLVTNLGVWAGGTLFEKSVSGLIACYTAAIPFFWNTLFGDLFYVGVFFGAYALYNAYAGKSQPSTVS